MKMNVPESNGHKNTLRSWYSSAVIRCRCVKHENDIHWRSTNNAEPVLSADTISIKMLANPHRASVFFTKKFLPHFTQTLHSIDIVIHCSDTPCSSLYSHWHKPASAHWAIITECTVTTPQALWNSRRFHDILKLFSALLPKLQLPTLYLTV